MSESLPAFNQAILDYTGMLTDLDEALAAVEAHGLQAMDTVLARLEDCRRRMPGGKDARGPAADWIGALAGESQITEGAAEVRQVMNELLLKSRQLTDRIRVAMGAVADEIVHVNKSRLYLNSLKNTYGAPDSQWHLKG